MSALVLPVHVADVNGKPLRFFRSPDPAPELPLHSFEDLLTVCGFNREERRHFTRMTQRDYGSKLRTVTTWLGPVTVAPHFIAQGLTGAAIDVGRAPKNTYDAYTKAGIAALDAIMNGVPVGDQPAFLMAAIRNSTDARVGDR